jgi:hypothetical protein
MAEDDCRQIRHNNHVNVLFQPGWRNEPVYRDEDKLRIIDTDGNSKATFACGSEMHTYYVVRFLFPNLLFYKENSRKSSGLFCIIKNYIYLCTVK